MPLYKMQVIQAADSLLPRHQIVNTLHFDDGGVGTDADGLAGDLADIFLASWYTAPRQVVVNVYEVGPPPQFPVGTAIRNEGLAPVSTWPREVALCLSYYAERNLPRQRGRLFLFVGGIGLSTAVRPQQAAMDKAQALALAFAGLGGVDVDWVVYSPTDATSRQVTNTWVDDEWDTIRSRGLDATTRIEAAHGA